MAPKAHVVKVWPQPRCCREEPEPIAGKHPGKCLGRQGVPVKGTEGPGLLLSLCLWLLLPCALCHCGMRHHRPQTNHALKAP